MNQVNLDERLLYLLLGCFIGFVLGYVTRTLMDIKEKVDEVDEIVKNDDRPEGGFARMPSLLQISLFFALAICVWAAFSTGSTNSKIEDVQEENRLTERCTSMYLTRVLDAVNERTTYSREQSEANINLQRTQAEFLTEALQDPPLEPQRVVDGLTRYSLRVQEYLDVAMRSNEAAIKNPYPTPEEYEMCLDGEME